MLNFYQSQGCQYYGSEVFSASRREYLRGPVQSRQHLIHFTGGRGVPVNGICENIRTILIYVYIYIYMIYIYRYTQIPLLSTYRYACSYTHICTYILLCTYIRIIYVRYTESYTHIYIYIGDFLLVCQQFWNNLQARAQHQSLNA